MASLGTAHIEAAAVENIESESESVAGQRRYIGVKYHGGINGAASRKYQ